MKILEDFKKTFVDILSNSHPEDPADVIDVFWKTYDKIKVECEENDYLKGYNKYYEEPEFRLEVLSKDMNGNIEKYLVSLGGEQFKNGVLKAREEITEKYIRDIKNTVL